MRKGTFVLAILILMTVIVSFYGTIAMMGIAEEVGEDTLIVADANTPMTFDPAVASDTASFAQLYNIYETLVKFQSSDAQNVYPCLATSWKISPDAKVYTFRLRYGVVFSNGNPFNAWCVKYSFERVISKATPDNSAYILADFIDKVEVLDSYTVRITLKNPYSGFLANLATVTASIVDPAVVKRYGDDWMTDHTIGTGPYTLKEWVRGKQVELKSNERWWGWGSTKHLTTVITKIVPNVDERVAMIVNGAVDIAVDIATDIQTRLPVLGYLQGIEVESQVSFGSFFFPMSNRVAPFNDTTVRQSVSYAFNYEEYLTEILKGLYVRSQGMIPNGMFGHVNDLPIRSYDPEKAEQLLSESDYPDGYSITIAYPTNRWYRERAREAALLMKENLFSIGWTAPIDVVGLTFAEAATKFRNGEIQMLYSAWWIDWCDPDNFVYTMAHSNGFYAECMGYSNPQVDALAIQARSTLDPEVRQALYRQIELQVSEDTLYVFLHQHVDYLARREWVKGIILNPALYGLQFSQIYKKYA